MSQPEIVELHELSVERVIDAPVATVWRAFTEHLALWWCPRPWTTEVVEQDMRPGGRFAVTMRGPDGEENPLESVVLEIVPERRLVFTNAFDAEWRPRTSPYANLVGIFSFEPDGDKTRYTALARHWDAEAAARHDALGFSVGWGMCADQLAEVATGLKETADA